MSDATGHFISDPAETRLLQLTCRNAPPKNQLQLRPSPRRVWGYDVQAFVGTSGHWKGRIAGISIARPQKRCWLKAFDAVKDEESAVSDCLIGSPGWNRTNDQRINSPTLYR